MKTPIRLCDYCRTAPGVYQCDVGGRPGCQTRFCDNCGYIWGDSWDDPGYECPECCLWSANKQTLCPAEKEKL